MTTAVLGIGVQAHAAPPHNVGWLYTQGMSGAIFFDADLAGSPSYEKITVCDNKRDGRGVEALVQSLTTNDAWDVFDASHDGKCVAYQGNLFPEEAWVRVYVWEYAGSWQSQRVHAEGYA